MTGRRGWVPPVRDSGCRTLPTRPEGLTVRADPASAAETTAAIPAPHADHSARPATRPLARPFVRCPVDPASRERVWANPRHSKLRWVGEWSLVLRLFPPVCDDLVRRVTATRRRSHRERTLAGPLALPASLPLDFPTVRVCRLPVRPRHLPCPKTQGVLRPFVAGHEDSFATCERASTFEKQCRIAPAGRQRGIA